MADPTRTPSPQQDPSAPRPDTRERSHADAPATADERERIRQPHATDDEPAPDRETGTEPDIADESLWRSDR
jgi:hypothetical protein